MPRISFRNCIECFCLKLYLMTHAFDIKRGEASVFRRKTILVVTCKNEKDPFKMKALEWSQHFSHCKSMGMFSDAQ